MNHPKSPCLTCSHTAICPDSWYGCQEWRTYLHDRWPEVTKRSQNSIRLMLLYRRGKNDREIAESVGLSTVAVFQWRKRNHLPPNGRRGRPPLAPPAGGNIMRLSTR